MAEDKITLDREAFRTLASGTRVDILKSLDKRRKTLSELAKQFSMSVSTVKEHLDTLVKAGLIEQKNDGHKWKYYDLTKKGKSVLHPEETRIWVILGLSAVAMVGTVYSMFNESLFQSMFSTTQSDLAQGSALMGAAKETAPAMVEFARNTASDSCGVGVQALPWFQIAGLVLFGVIIGMCTAYILLGRKRAREI